MTRVLNPPIPQDWEGELRACGCCSLSLPATPQFFQRSGNNLRTKCKLCRYEDQLRGPRPPEKPCDRICKKCGRNAEQVAFRQNKRICKPCANAESRTYHAANRERLIVQMREYQRRNADTLRKKQKAYQEANRDRILQKKREYYAARAEEKRQWMREYHQKKPEVLRSYNQRRSDRDRLLQAAEEGKQQNPYGFTLVMYRTGYYAPIPADKPLRPGAQPVCEVLPADWLNGGWEIVPKMGAAEGGRVGELLERWWRRKGLMLPVGDVEGRYV